MSLIPGFQLLLASNTSGLDSSSSGNLPALDRLSKLVKRMDKSFEEKGDFTCPSDPTVWKKVSGGLCSEVDAKKAISEVNGCLRVESVKVDGPSMFVNVNRPLLLGALLPKAVSGEFNGPAEKPLNLRVDNCELRRAARSSALSQLRCHVVTSLTRRLLIAAGHTLNEEEDSQIVFRIGCTDVKLLKEHSSSAAVEPVQVGVVMESKKKKSSASSILPTYDMLFQRYLRIASERNPTPNLRNVHASASADLTLQLLSVQTASPCTVVDECAQTASVMYNYVRLVHILNAFEGDLPVGQDVDYGLLKEPEEWELVFNYLLPYEELFEIPLRLHRVPQLLFGLSSTFSRYYNRVHVLKEPTPSLLPTMKARIFLLMGIKALYEKMFRLLDIQPVYNM